MNTTRNLVINHEDYLGPEFWVFDEAEDDRLVASFQTRSDAQIFLDAAAPETAKERDTRLWKIKLLQGELFIYTADDKTRIAQIMGYGSPEGKENATLICNAPESARELHELQQTNAKLGLMYVQEVPDLETKVDELCEALRKIGDFVKEETLTTLARLDHIQAIVNAESDRNE